jgi:hypothetical protein
MRMDIPLRRRAASIGVVAALGFATGCHSGGSKGPHSAPTNGSPSTSTTTGAGSNVAPTSLVAPTDPPVTEPAADVAKLRAILLDPSDVPTGFAAGPVGDTGGDLLMLRLCGQPLDARAATAATAATASVRQVLLRSRDNLRMVEEVAAYADTAGAAVALSDLRALGRRCRQDGPTSVSAVQPLPVGEEVAGLHVSRPTGVVDVAMIRSGPFVVVVALSALSPIPTSTVQSIVQAAGTKLAAGTGG